MLNRGKIMRNSEEIKKDILAHLKWDNRISSSDIQIDIINKTVILSGYVKSLLEKNAAENDAQMIPGVNKVENRIVIKQEKYEKPSDDKILWNIQSILSLNSNIDSSKFDISVDKGIVFLKGFVDEFWKKLKTEELVLMIPGVLDIVNTLAVVHSPLPFDRTVALDILSALGRIGTINLESITVEVEGGRVTIRGKVPDWYSYSSVFNIVKYTRGVSDFVNNLVISD
jgi:osmotically-inducible protein OsmY